MIKKEISTVAIRVDEIEILRGIAAVSVVFYHILVLGEFQNINKSLDTVVNHFGMAVPLFYAISAFSLLYGYEKNIFNEDVLKRFYIRRFFRLAPLFYFMLIFYSIYLFIEFNHKSSLGTYLLNLTFTYMLVPSQHESMVWAGWSVGMEWLFYFAFPLMVLMSRSIIVLLIVFFISLIVSIKFTSLTLPITEVSASSNYMNIMKHIVFFITGMLIFKSIPLANKIKNKINWIKRLDVVYFIVAIGIFVVLERYINYEVLEVSLIVVLLFGAYLGFSKIFNNYIFKLMGKCSYGLYLLNPIIIVTLNNLGFYKYIKNSINSPVLNYLTGSAITLIIIVVFSNIAYMVIEQPGIKAGQKVIDKFIRKS